MRILNYIKFSIVGVIIAALGFFIWDYKALREFKTEAKIELAKKDIIIQQEGNRIKSLESNIVYLTEQVQKISSDMQKIRKVAEEEKKAINLEKLVKVSNLTNEYSSGKERLTNRAKKATEKIFNELETLSDLSTITK